MAVLCAACGGNGAGTGATPGRPEPSRAAGSTEADAAAEQPAGPGRLRDGGAPTAADLLRPEVAGALPTGFPGDIPLGDWVAVEAVRLMGDDGFVLECTAAGQQRDAVCEFFTGKMPLHGWKPVSDSRKTMLSVLSFRKDGRAVTVMVKRQAVGEPVAFDLSYKEN